MSNIFSEKLTPPKKSRPVKGGSLKNQFKRRRLEAPPERYYQFVLVAEVAAVAS